MDDAALSRTALFQGSGPEEVGAMLSCLGAQRRRFAKGQAVYRAGDIVTSLGMVLSGRVLIENDDLWGNTTVLDSVGPGQIAAEDAEVLFLNVERVLRVCPRACAHHGRLLRNLLTLSAQKNLNLSRKIFHTSAKSIRGRLLSYLSDQAMRSGSRRFTIPFDRQQLADYLNVDRSALSNELSKMQREGLLRTRRNYFELLGEEDG